MKSRVLPEIKPYLIAFVSSAVPALVFTLLVRLWLMNEVFLRTLFTLLAWFGGVAALLSSLMLALVRFARLLYAHAAPKESKGKFCLMGPGLKSSPTSSSVSKL